MPLQEPSEAMRAATQAMIGKLTSARLDWVAYGMLAMLVGYAMLVLPRLCW